mgnify:FL=1
MPPTPAEKPGVTTSSREKILLAGLLVLFVLAYHQLFTWETAADVVPEVVSAFFSPSGVSTQFLYVLVIGLLLIRRDDIAAAYRCQGKPWSALFYLVPGVCLFLWGAFVNALDLVHVSLVVVAFGVARLIHSGRVGIRQQLHWFFQHDGR